MPGTVVPRGFVDRVSSVASLPEAETIRVRAPRVIRADQCMQLFQVQMVQVGPDRASLAPAVLQVREDALMLQVVIPVEVVSHVVTLDTGP